MRRVPSSALHCTFLNSSAPALLANMSLHLYSPEISQSPATYPHLDSAQEAYRDEAGIGAACLYQLLDQA
jgi:hypothetical protein